jgi:hypothetical protein
MGESIKGLVKKALYWQFENYLAERGGGQTDCLGRVQLLCTCTRPQKKRGGEGEGEDPINVLGIPLRCIFAT